MLPALVLLYWTHLDPAILASTQNLPLNVQSMLYNIICVLDESPRD